ncbi:DNA/RNA non-specific endonuclease [Stutzerimonas urumqiensis]|uniref:DNA/RNA non-specific endonuclease n=1 Tax=Stutzerimonas urumqiensis TaxID=638269 RepID=UPI003BADA69C
MSESAVQLLYRPRLADLRPLGTPSGVQSITALAPARTTPAEVLADRTGYQADFLGAFQVPWPRASEALQDDLLPVPGNAKNRLDYTHFSITMSQSRRLALFVGVNIEGSALVDIARDKDRWTFDGRIPSDAQVGEFLYADNQLDRGHLVRRQDPNWGAKAEQANADTFHFTNCSPQMAGFNQKNWLDLENYLLDNTRRWRARATVFSGPVFAEDDLVYRGVRIPRAFWKVVAFLGEDGKPSATAYMIDQSGELGRLTALFGRFRTYQRSVLHIERLTGIDFGDLSNYDGFSNEERATGTRIEAELISLDAIRV